MNFLAENNSTSATHYEIKKNMLSKYLTDFIKNKNGCLVESSVNNLTFQYFTQIDQFQQRKTLFLFQQRKNSYKFNLFSKINPNSIIGGIINLKKKIEQFNKRALNENSLYYLNEPNLFALRCNIQKDASLFQNEQQFIKSVIKLIQSTSKQFNQFLIKIVQMGYQDTNNSFNIKQMTELVNSCKNYYSQEVKRRNRIQIQKEYQYNIINFNKPNTYVSKDESKGCTEQQISKLNACFRRLKLQKVKTPPNNSKPLAHKIKIMKQNVDQNWKAPQSSYGTLERVQAQYITLDSFNTFTALHLKKQKSEAEIYCHNVLVRKNYRKDFSCSCTEEKVDPKCKCYVRIKSYNTEVTVVSFIRNISIDSVASYFLEDNEPIDKALKLYSQFYPNSLIYDKNKGKDVFYLILNILQAIKAFQNAGILHRDLKPNNILLDSKKIPKIIDFGSAWILNKDFPQYSQINQQLYTTKKYNLYFQQALFGERHKMTSSQFQKHPLYDMHAIGIIIRQLFSDSNISSELGSFILMSLSWLCAKCTQHNPNLRLNAQEAFNFCSLLSKFWSIKFGHLLK